MSNIFKENLDIVRSKLEKRYIVDIYLRTQEELVAYTKTLIQTWLFNKALKDSKFSMASINTDEAAKNLLYCILISHSKDLIQKYIVSIGKRLGGTSVVDSADKGASLLVSLAQENNILFDLNIHKMNKTGETYLQLIKKIKLPSSDYQKIKNLIPLPPKKVVTDWISNNKHDPFANTTTSILLGKAFNGNKQKQCYDDINILQQTPYKLDFLVYLTYANTNKNMELSKFREIVAQVGFDKFFLEWFRDKRGRSYSSGYFLNLQASDYFKSLLSLEHTEKLSEIGYQNLKYAIANTFKQDKTTWTEREQWFNSNYPGIETLEKLQKQGFSEISRLNKENAGEPVMAYKLENALEEVSLGSGTDILISFDATNSGYQIYSILTGDLITAGACNLLPNTKVQDLYSEIGQEMNKHLQEKDKIILKIDDTLLKHTTNEEGLIVITEVKTNELIGITRSKLKKAVMTSAYNSKKVPKTIFSRKQLQVFYKTLARITPEMVKLRNFINTKIWDAEKLVNRFVMPDGLEVVLPNFSKSEYTLQIEELENFSTPFTCYENKGIFDGTISLPANIIHAVDGYVAREMVRMANKQGFTLVHIHDCFKSTCNNAPKVRENYRTILSKIAESNLLNDIIGQLTNNQLSYPKKVNNLPKLILQTEYALT